MSQVPPATASVAMPQESARTSASPSEKSATLPAPARSHLSTPAPVPVPKLRSCVVCRNRKVRCDKQSPCSNCRRANIACVFPSTDRPPRWARRMDRITISAASSTPADAPSVLVMDRLRNLENLVKELRGELEHANAAAGGSSGVNTPEGSSHDRDTDHQRDSSTTTNSGNIQKQFGRLVLQDANRSRYVSSGFWSRVNDELEGLKMDSRSLGEADSDSSEDEASPGKSSYTQELERTPSERHAFLFRHNLSPSAPDLREFHPLPSQIPFILNVFSENINFVIGIVHLPTVRKMIRDLRGSHLTSLTPANEALMFSIYYATITSMEEDDIAANFGLRKADLNMKYRIGLEHALAKADFLNVPDLVLIQAFAIFLFLVRRHDSPRFVWMMTGLVIRMGQALGLHRDGTRFEHLTPYEIEMRRRVWWSLCVLDVRASEDQGTDYTIARGSFDTKHPLNLNDTDIAPETTQMPKGREGIADMSYPLVTFQICEVTRQIMSQNGMEDAPDIEEQSRLLNDIYVKLDQGYLQYSVQEGNVIYWAGVMVARLVIAKMTLFIYLPILFAPSSDQLSHEIRTKLLIAAIENAEYNHALNAEEAARQWRWAYQTYTHWYAIVYLLIEISRRPWSPIVERAWVALHSKWLIPAQSHMDENLRVWIPLRKLMAKARKHRDAELDRLRRDPQAVEQLEIEDQKIPIPGSPGPFPAGANAVQLFIERWRQIIMFPERSEYSEPGDASSSAHSIYTAQQSTSSLSIHDIGGLDRNAVVEPIYSGPTGTQISQSLPSKSPPDFQSVAVTNTTNDFALGENTRSHLYDDVPVAPTARSNMGPDFIPWLWADTGTAVDNFANVDISAIDVNMDLDGDVDWYSWVESAKGMELDTGPPVNGLA